MVQTRRSTRFSATPATTATTATTSTSVSPSLTDHLSVEPETPLTSDLELPEITPKHLANSCVMNRISKKRVADTQVEEIEPVVVKRRVVSKSVFVEIPVVSSKDKGKGRAVEQQWVGHGDHQLCGPEDESELIEETEPSGSEFELSELDDISVNGAGENDYVPPSDADEAQMMSVAIEMSHQTARLEAERDSGAGPSSGVTPKKAPQTFNRRPPLRRRFNRRKRRYADSEDETDFVLESDDDSELSKLTDNESATAKRKDDDDDLGDESVVYESIEAEFRATSKKLGRRLTLAERSRIRFLFHHPELRNVWKDLRRMAVVAPEKADQPAGLKVTLLPFQQESLSWMRKQEESIWKGGILALDEAHNIKERSTNTAKACFELQSNYKWCLSGTPLQNRVGELYSLVRYLGGDPFSYYFCRRCGCKSLHWRFTDKKTCDDCGHGAASHTCFWNQEILTPIQKYGMIGPGQVGFKRLRILLDRIMLRRTKIQRADDLGLPPRTVIVRRDYFSPEEKELYLSLFTDAKRQFNTYVHSGTVLNNYSNIFSLITRMRQMACHPDLVLRSRNNGNQFLNTEELGEGTVCRLCNDFAEDAIQAKCRHIFDRECIKQYLSASCDISPKCPICHLPLTIDLEGPALELAGSAPAARQGILGRLDLDTWQSSSKIEALVEELSNLRLQDAATKSIVFSQFVNFLDLIAYRLQRAGFQICRLEGGMSPSARDATIQHFMNNVEVTVFLVSLKAGGVALNLTEASRVYLMDSWWNPAAMDRIHRLGQHRPVQAIKLVIEDSIESRIIQLQEKKSAMVDATLSTDDSAMGRLTPEDVSNMHTPPSCLVR
ncbi:hypothetical protein PISMIDRAFT_680849 [Pisolithus microcarpus 441]|uniref:DNA repair protein RAD16 n=1 Tax=Pisolithus microcarpus 441 TaxID=765257 RepID=A0A0C9ZQ87_9AGAM|nr:hypothetical protein PISMIDRAFT_680849 [Pisolithus microcarpus 441]